MFIAGPSSDIRPFDWYTDNPAPTHTGRVASDVQALGWLLATQVGVAAGGALLRRNIEITAVQPFTDTESDRLSLSIGEGLFMSSTAPQSTRFGTALTDAPGTTVFLCANLGGAPFAE